jgi:glycosyltransferase involved in cell wall biosynthesis
VFVACVSQASISLDRSLQRSDTTSKMNPTRPPLRIAYLVNQYPQPSQSFIRREIAAMEALGPIIRRYSVRRWNGTLVDSQDRAEQEATQVVLDVGVIGLAWALLKFATTSPLVFWRALKFAARLGRRSERGLAYHLIYLAEACVLKTWFQKDQIEHVHAHFGTNSATVAVLCRALGGPTCSVTVHGPEEFDQPRSLALDEKIKWSSFVVAISEFGRSQLCRWASYDQWPKIQIVRCGLDSLFLRDDPSPPPLNRRLVCVGRLAEQKGQLVLIKAAARLKREGQDFELIQAGDGPLRSEIEAAIHDHGLAGMVRLVGWQSNTEVRDLIRSSRAMVLPSFAEGLPVVIMEALALGRPVISTYVAGIPELVEPGVTGWLVPASSEDALAEAMRAALEANPEQLHEMGRLGALRVAERHDARIEASRLESLIRDVVQGSNNPGTSDESRTMYALSASER